MGRVDYVNIYHEQTNKLNHGHPLYNPDYQQPEEPGGPLEIGDVGLLYRRMYTVHQGIQIPSPPFISVSSHRIRYIYQTIQCG